MPIRQKNTSRVQSRNPYKKYKQKYTEIPCQYKKHTPNTPTFQASGWLQTPRPSIRHLRFPASNRSTRPSVLLTCQTRGGWAAWRRIADGGNQHKTTKRPAQEKLDTWDLIARAGPQKLSKNMQAHLEHGSVEQSDRLGWSIGVASSTKSTLSKYKSA